MLWPLLAAHVARVGVRAFRAAPLHAQGAAAGSLNLYSRTPGSLRNPNVDVDVLTVITEYLERGMDRYHAVQLGEPEAQRVRAVVDEYNLIQYAVGVLMARDHLDGRSARATLEIHAGDQQVSIRTAARDVISQNTPRAPR